MDTTISNAAMLGAGTLLLLILLAVGSSMYREAPDYGEVPEIVGLAVSACIDSQIEIGNPGWDRELRRPISADIDQVETIIHPVADSFIVVFTISNVYPDGPFSMCHIGKESGGVLLAVYSNGADEEFVSFERSSWDPLSGSDAAVRSVYPLSSFVRPQEVESPSRLSDEVLSVPHCGFSVSGLVYDTAGLPVESASVSVKFSLGDTILSTDDSGKFEFDDHFVCFASQAGPVVTIYKSGYQPYVGGGKNGSTIEITLRRLDE